MQGNAEERKRTMAHYVLADVYGETDRFHAMLEKIHVSANDTLYILGAVIDRGSDWTTLIQLLC